jgi:hypothetical protein
MGAKKLSPPPEVAKGVEHRKPSRRSELEISGFLGFSGTKRGSRRR